MLFVGGFVSYCVVCRRVRVLLCCLCLFAYSGVQHFAILCVFTFIVLCCLIHYDFRINAMYILSLPSVVCKRNRVLFAFSLSLRIVVCYMT